MTLTVLSGITVAPLPLTCSSSLGRWVQLSEPSVQLGDVVPQGHDVLAVGGPPHHAVPGWYDGMHLHRGRPAGLDGPGQWITLRAHGVG